MSENGSRWASYGQNREVGAASSAGRPDIAISSSNFPTGSS